MDLLDEDQKSKSATHGLRLRVTKEEHAGLKQEAENYGYDLSTLLRLRIFGKLKGIRITRRPSADMMMLGDIMGKLSALTAEVNKVGSNMNQIAKRLNQGSRDVFGLDGCLRLFEAIGQKILKVLNQIETAITGKSSFSQKDDEE